MVKVIVIKWGSKYQKIRFFEWPTHPIIEWFGFWKASEKQSKIGHFWTSISAHSLNTSRKMSKEDKFGTVRLIMWLLPFENPIIWSPDFGRLVFRWLTVLVKRKLRRNFFILFFTIGILSTSSIQLFFCGDCPGFDAPSWRHFACRKRGGKTPLSKLHRKWYHNGTL